MNASLNAGHEFLLIGIERSLHIFARIRETKSAEHRVEKRIGTARISFECLRNQGHNDCALLRHPHFAIALSDGDPLLQNLVQIRTQIFRSLRAALGISGAAFPEPAMQWRLLKAHFTNVPIFPSSSICCGSILLEFLLSAHGLCVYESLARCRVGCGLAGKFLVPLDRYIDVGRIEFHQVSASAGLLRRQ